jgi:hypothetical protein
MEQTLLRVWEMMELMVALEEPEVEVLVVLEQTEAAMEVVVAPQVEVGRDQLELAQAVFLG